MYFTGKKASLYDQSNPDWAPSLKMTPVTNVEKVEMRSESAVKRYHRARGLEEKRERRSAAQGIVALFSTDPVDVSEPTLHPEGKVCRMFLRGPLEPVTTVRETEPVIVGQMRKEVQRLMDENRDLKAKLAQAELTPESMKDDKEKVNHFTGLNYVTLMAIVAFISPCLTENGRTALTKFQKVLLVLMKLRMNLSMQYLGYCFNVSTGCVSKTFNDTLHVMYIMMKGFVYWPDREELRLAMPMDFRKYFGLKVSVIIDCFEIFVDRPSGLDARAKTWSNYKHHNTVKFLIGITPQGSVSFISEAWGGRASDKFITENCGLLRQLLPGDVVLADRGFDIGDSVGLMCAEVKIPAFTKGKKQLSALEIESTRKIAQSHTRRESDWSRKK